MTSTLSRAELAPGEAVGRRIDRSRKGRRLARPRATTLVESAVVLVTLVVLERLVFLRYFDGETTPQWDFYNHYTTEAHAWWGDGSFFRPVEWLPYLWGGYPGVANLQNSSWYLPVGVVEALFGYTPQTAAVLSAVTVGFGALGTYLLLRVWGLRPSAAMIGLIAWFFAAGFYSNASHLDIARAYAWVPWVLLCASPRWPWRRWWAPVVAVLVFWQAIMGIYPGILIAAVYVGAVWVVGVQVFVRPKVTSYLLPLAGAMAVAVALTMLRFLPFYLARGTSAPGTGDVSEMSWELLGTFLFPYADPSLPNDITMRSFFLPAVVLAACAFVRWRDPLSRIAGLTGLAALVLGLPGTPWERIVVHLPGLDVSRFRMSDFKVFFLLALCVLAAAAVNDIVTRRQAMSRAGVPVLDRSPTRWVGPALYLVVLLAVLANIGDDGPFEDQDWRIQWGLVVLAAGLLLLAQSTLKPFQLRAVVALVALVAVLSGVVWAFTTQVTWSTPRIGSENAAYGAQVDALVASRQPSGVLERRPEREVLETEDTEPGAIAATFFSPLGGASFFDGRSGVTGYVNLKGTPTFEAMAQALADPATAEAALAFWRAPGMVVRTDGGALPSLDETADCLADGACGLGSVVPVAYETSTYPVLTYQVEAEEPSEISFNESYYAGWTVEACAVDDPTLCEELVTRSGSSGQLVAQDLSPGTWTVTATYRLPGMTAAWTVFAVGVAAAAGWSLVLGLRARRERVKAE
ncbi:hypothetical protein [Oerskovia jenensis]|uniref:hypothetical protein n=1 Tax=Oerskovia jenensis TaxID=162169 RepID=UPI0036DBEA40